jgi:hypothetical protein
MRNPERWRNVAIAVLLAGPAAIVVAFAAPEPSLPEKLRGALIALGLLGILFGGTCALVLQQGVKRQRRMARGEGLLARWRLPAPEWRAFLQLDAERNARGDRERNTFTPRDPPSPGDVDILVAKDAIEIEGSLHVLPRHGIPLVTRAQFDESRVGPSVIELELDYPGDGISEAGSPSGPKPGLLRFPVPAGAQVEARAVVAHYGQEGPGEPSFFHGRGDGSDPEDLTRCWKCGFETYRLVANCERCGATMVSKRWARRYGVILVVIGLFLSIGMAILLANMLPTLLHPGVEVGGSRFTGSPGMAKFVMLILGSVLVFGLTALGYGIFQIVTGRRSWAVVRAMLAIVGGLYVVAWVIRAGWLG